MDYLLVKTAKNVDAQLIWIICF